MSTLLLLPLFGFAAAELTLLLAVVVLLFGGAKLAGLGRGLGTAIFEFRKGMKGADEAPASGTAPNPDGRQAPRPPG